MNPSSNLLDKIKGALYGVAVGDAFGGPLEFLSADQIAKQYGRVTEMIGGGWLDLRPGETTDDTAMTLAVAEGIMEAPDAPCEAIGKRFVIWANGGPKDIGGTCSDGIFRAKRKAAERGLEFPDAACWEYGGKTTAEHHKGRSAGNGALMRAVYPALYYPDREKAVQETVAQGSMTHWDDESNEACRIYAELLHGVLTAAQHGKSSREDFSTVIRDILRETRYHLDGIQEKIPTGRLKPSGYVVETLECSLAAWISSSSFRDAIIQAANLGGDADTIAAICGGLSGAVYGFHDIPNMWITALSAETRTRLQTAAQAACQNWNV